MLRAKRTGIPGTIDLDEGKLDFDNIPIDIDVIPDDQFTPNIPVRFRFDFKKPLHPCSSHWTYVWTGWVPSPEKDMVEVT